MRYKETMTDFMSPLKWILELTQNPGCSHFLRQFLDFIRDEMIVVDTSKRARIGQVAKWLASRSEACGMDKLYALGLPVSTSQESTNERGNSGRQRSSVEADESLITRLWKRLV